MVSTFSLRDSVAVVLVSSYLLAVGCFLIVTQRIPPLGFLKILRARTRRPYAGVLDSAQPEQGYCFVAGLPEHLLCDRDHASWLVLFEDGVELGPAHATQDSIRALGGGKFSHWGSWLYFSTSDNSDPRSNARSYTVREVRG